MPPSRLGRAIGRCQPGELAPLSTSYESAICGGRAFGEESRRELQRSPTQTAADDAGTRAQQRLNLSGVSAAEANEARFWKLKVCKELGIELDSGEVVSRTVV